MMPQALAVPPESSVTRPRLGFLGVGWIGKSRLEAILASGLAEVVAVADPVPELARQASLLAGECRTCASLDELLSESLDGLVIATPSALHAEQSIAGLERSIAVFCQKPLGRSAAETGAVLNAARGADRLLGVDLSYRYIHAAAAAHELCRSGELGDLYAADLVFHNAYGPDKPWFYHRRLSGGGCVMDLGIHLADLALWNLGFPAVLRTDSRLRVQGRPLPPGSTEVEDFAEATVDLANGALLRLSCSWKLHAGSEAVIAATFYGTRGAVSFHNVNGSFYDFIAEQFQGTRRQTIAGGPDAWPGRAGVVWAQRLAQDRSFDPAAQELLSAARLLDGIYRAHFGGEGEA